LIPAQKVSGVLISDAESAACGLGVDVGAPTVDAGCAGELAWRLCRRGSVVIAPPEGMADWPFVAAVRATSALKSGARTLAETTIFQELSEWARLGSNQRPLAYEATTLPASNRRFCLQISLIHAHP
jgi:hypothetical protein